MLEDFSSNGSGSVNATKSALSENIPVKNSFQALDDVDQLMKEKENCVLESMEEEYESEIWPKLKQDVINILESGIYPSSSVRANWSIAQVNFFYQNYSKYGFDPSLEDDDVATEDGGMASEMRSEGDVVKARTSDMGGAPNINWVSNNASCSNGTGIIVWWDPNFIRVMVITSGRKALWRELGCHSLVVKDEPWLLMGDFNVILDPSERSAGSSYFTSGMEDFKDCLGVIGVEDFVMSGLRFTWNKSLGSTDGLLNKLDRDKQVPGHAMFSVVSKLKLLKKPLRKLKLAQEDLAKRVIDLRHELERDEESMLKQRAKVDWLSEGDANTMFFHKTVKGNLNRNKIKNVEDMNGRDDPMVDIPSLFTKRLSREDADFMVRPVTRDEIKGVVFGMNDDKALGPDGFSSKVFKSALSIMGSEIITKIIANIIKGFLGKLVDESQNAFIPSRKISDNVLLTQELIRNYHRNPGPTKVAFKIDIHKAYDSVEWKCHGYFKGIRGLRQGNPLSPYLFTLVMEVFLLMVKRRIKEDGAFKYHWRCNRLKLTHLSFADDLMVFSKADVHSVMILSKALKEFSGVSGLVPNLDKSSVFFGNVPEFLKSEILHVLPLLLEFCLSIHVYWASSFILSKSVNAEIEQLMCGFLWSYGELRRGYAKDVPILNDACWGWRKMLQCKDVLRKHIVHRIGDGTQTSVWFDNWLSLDPLSHFISKRDICEAGFPLDCKGGRLFCSLNLTGSLIWLAFMSEVVSESHNHLFLNAGFRLRSIWSILQRLVIGAMVYFIWQERNLRRFQAKSRLVNELCGMIRDNVRLKLMSLKIRKSVQVMEAAGLWDFGVDECNVGKSYCFRMNGVLGGKSIMVDGYFIDLRYMVCWEGHNGEKSDMGICVVVSWSNGVF
ncbi:putative reverse transcriptase domain-containing protein [Tanacetum coccineum]